MSARILVVEDDRTMAEVLLAYLRRSGYDAPGPRTAPRPTSCGSGLEPDLVVLDLMLPGMSGLELLRRRRELADEAAVIILSARGEEEDRLVGLETGADDYVVKPFSPREMVLRVEALLRRTERLAGTQLVNRRFEVGELRSTSTRGTALQGRPPAVADHPRVRPAGLSGRASRPDVQQGRAAATGVGLGVRRHLDRHRARTSAAREARGAIRPIRRSW